MSLSGDFDPTFTFSPLQTALNALSRPAPDDPRKAEQRRADALVELCRRALDTGRLPEVGGQKPHLSVTVSAAALAGVSGAEAAELAWGGVCRTPPCGAWPATRRALAARDGGCRFPGCDRPTADSCGAKTAAGRRCRRRRPPGEIGASPPPHAPLLADRPPSSVTVLT